MLYMTQLAGLSMPTIKHQTAASTDTGSLRRHQICGGGIASRWSWQQPLNITSCTVKSHALLLASGSLNCTAHEHQDRVSAGACSGCPGSTHEPGHAEGHSQRIQVRLHGHHAQPAAAEDWHHVWQPRGHLRRASPQILCIRPDRCEAQSHNRGNKGRDGWHQGQGQGKSTL